MGEDASGLSPEILEAIEAAVGRGIRAAFASMVLGRMVVDAPAPDPEPLRAAPPRREWSPPPPPQRSEPTGPLSWEDELASLNTRASRELERCPEPEGCPPAGVWLREAWLDEDLQPDPAGMWHLSTGWDSRQGRLRSRCGRPRDLWRNLDHSGYQFQHSRATVLRSETRPEADVCSGCIAGAARDAEKGTAEA